MLELKNLKKSYKIGEIKQLVLKGIDIKFRKNEFTSILGSSGSGKTTLLNLIGGLDKYDSGDIIIENESTRDYKERDWDSYRNYRVGFIFQSYNLIMHQTILSNVEMALTLSGVSKEERKKRATDALIKVGLKDHLNKKPNQLSGGQMQRVAIARAIVNDPEIILADEPTGALDSKTSIQIMDLLKEISKDKLVIMVTHNKELAKDYSTRIIELKDGLIVNDSNPFEGSVEKSNKKIKKTSMSFITTILLSFNNLLTKKGRTFLTAFAGSIGIIGISLILSLSNGVNNYAKDLEKNSLKDYPITIERTSYDIFGSLALSLNDTSYSIKCEADKICSKDDLVKNSIIDSSKGLMKKNNLKELKKYIDNNQEFKDYSDSINYKYNLDLLVYTKDYNKVNPSNLTNKEKSIIFNELDNKINNYELLSGNLPNSYNEVVLVIGSDNKVNDSILYSLGIKDKDILQSDLEKIKEDEKYSVDTTNYKYEDILNKEYILLLNTDIYKEDNEIFMDYSNDKTYMKNKIDNGLTIKIVGIVRNNNDSNSFVGYTNELTKYIISEISKTNIYKKQINNKDINVITGQAFDGINNTYDNIVQALGVYEIDDPSSIDIYPKDFDSKQKITDLINKYNDEKKTNKEDNLVVSYQDVMKSVVSGITNVINIISYVLIAFVAISLIVSSIMIAIITYISVLERTKEIGILRAIKKDIRRVFRSETIIEGLIAGLLGVGIALLLTFGINIIISMIAKIDNIASMPILGAVLLVLLSVLLNVIAGAIPASMAAQKDPVDALRTE